MDALKEFKNKKIQNVTKDNLDFETEEEKKSKEAERKNLSERFQPLLEKVKTCLNEQIKDVRLSDRLTETAVCLVSDSHGPTAHMEKIMAQFQGMDGAPASANKRILEVNPKHPVVEKMLTLEGEQLNIWSEILYGQALLNEGSSIPDPVKYSKLINSVMIQQTH
jgi:molecular chaperone HtpG